MEQWKNQCGHISLLSNKALTPLEAFDSPQISLLNKYTPELLGAKITVLLMEMAMINSCKWTSESVGMVAKAIAVEFYMLRFDELVYVFRNGPRGNFTKDGKVTFGAFEHKDLAAWLRYYQGTERLEAEAVHRNVEKETFATAQKEILSVIPTAFVQDMVHKMTVKGIEDDKKASEGKPAPTLETLDEQQWTMFVENKKKILDRQLKKILIASTAAGFTKTAAEVEKEIERRKTA